jgi:hypothetical protein
VSVVSPSNWLMVTQWKPCLARGVDDRRDGLDGGAVNVVHEHDVAGPGRAVGDGGGV